MAENKNQGVEYESRIQELTPYIVLFVLCGAVVFYLVHFPNGLSDKQSNWGQFGDFVGGLVNPIIGCFTIWLLTFSLRQNHMALDQAAASQAATENALRSQIEIAEHAKDMQNTIALLNYYRDIISNSQRIEAQYKQTGGNDSGRDIQDVRSDHLVAKQRIDDLLMMVDSERHRLVKKYVHNG